MDERRQPALVLAALKLLHTRLVWRGNPCLVPRYVPREWLLQHPTNLGYSLTISGAGAIAIPGAIAIAIAIAGAGAVAIAIAIAIALTVALTVAVAVAVAIAKP